MAAKVQGEGWQAHMGNAMPVKASSSKVASATNAAKGGVALLARKGVPIKKAPHDHDTALLRDQGRWEEVTQAIGTGNRHVKIASLYGYDGASGNAERFKLNEDLLGKALLKMLETGDTPTSFAACCRQRTSRKRTTAPSSAS